MFVKPLFTKFEKNNCFITYKRNDLNKIREGTIKKYDLIDGDGDARGTPVGNIELSP